LPHPAWPQAQPPLSQHAVLPQSHFGSLQQPAAQAAAYPLDKINNAAMAANKYRFMLNLHKNMINKKGYQAIA
jgi:hypothetical protein